MDKNNNITMIHIVAAIMVIIGHQFVLLGFTPPSLFGIDIHGLGVRILFLISGYLVTASYLRAKNTGMYIWKRIIRLYPPLLLCLILTVLLMRVVTDAPEYYWRSAGRYVLNNLEMRPKFDLAGVFANNPYPTGVNGSLWTLPIEMACYFALIPIVKIFKICSKLNKKVGDIFVLLLLMVLSALDLYKVINMNGKMLVWWDTDWFNGVALGIWFLIGVLFQLLALRRICNWQVGVLVTIIYVCCPSVVKYVITPYVVGYLTMCFALAEDPCFQKTFKRDICYGMYLYAFPVQQLLIQVLMIRKQISVSPYVLIVITVGVVSAIAIIQSIFIEEKCFSKIFVK